jgi:hypothetical protein
MCPTLKKLVISVDNKNYLFEIFNSSRAIKSNLIELTIKITIHIYDTIISYSHLIVNDSIFGSRTLLIVVSSFVGGDDTANCYFSFKFQERERNYSHLSALNL